MKNEITNAQTLPPKALSSDNFLRDWAIRNEHAFEDVMEQLRDELPQKWADLYLRIKMEATKTSLEKQAKNNIENINVNINKLDTLGDIKDSSWREPKATQYEEV